MSTLCFLLGFISSISIIFIVSLFLWQYSVYSVNDNNTISLVDNPCLFRFSVFDMNCVRFLYGNEYIFNNSWNKRIFDHFYEHRCYTSDYHKSLILISSIGATARKPTSISPKPTSEPFFESFIFRWAKYINNKYKQENRKYLFFFTKIYANIPFNPHITDKINNIGRITEDAFDYFFNHKLDISLPIQGKINLNEEIIFNKTMKTYIFSFRGSNREYFPSFIKRKYNKLPLLRNKHLRQTLDHIFNNNKYESNQFIYTNYLQRSVVKKKKKKK
eukprot:553578_1